MKGYSVCYRSNYLGPVPLYFAAFLHPSLCVEPLDLPSARISDGTDLPGDAALSTTFGGCADGVQAPPGTQFPFPFYNFRGIVHSVRSAGGLLTRAHSNQRGPESLDHC